MFVMAAESPSRQKPAGDTTGNGETAVYSITAPVRLGKEVKGQSMFESEIAINEFLLGNFASIVKDLPEVTLFQPAAGHGHSPIWIMGHLTIVGEMGQRQLGGTVKHIEWLRLFGPGSSGTVEPRADLNREALCSAVVETYQQLRQLAEVAHESTLSRPHGIKVFEGTPIKTVKHSTALLLTNHFGFHLAQLSSCRRMAGYGPLF